MKLTLPKVLSALLLVSAAHLSGAETTATPPAGYFKLKAEGGSDNLLSLPLARRTAWMGRVTAVTASQVTLATGSAVESGVAAPSPTNWYYAEFVTGDLAGLTYSVAGNTDSTFTLETQGDSLTSHALGSIATGEAGDIVRIRSGWSVASVFGEATDLILAPSPPFTGGVYLGGDAVLLPDNDALGVEKKPAAVFAYVAGHGWRKRGAGESNAAGQALPPWIPFTVRRGDYEPIQIVVVGYVPIGPRLVRLPSLPADGEMDFAITWGQGVPQTLAGTGLGSVVDASPSAFEAADLLLDYTGIRRGFSRPPERVFRSRDGQWFEGDVAQDEVLLMPGAGYLLRLSGERPRRYWRQDQPE